MIISSLCIILGYKLVLFHILLKSVQPIQCEEVCIKLPEYRGFPCTLIYKLRRYKAFVACINSEHKLPL